MTPALQRPDATIARVEVCASGADPVMTRLHVERLLGMLDLRPRALARSAILCVRELRDPMPGMLALDGRHAHPPPAWKHAMQRELDRMAREAAWPARDAVPATSEAVAFEDETELLACLGSDLATGALSGRWWWPLLVRGAVEPQRMVAAAWLRAVEHTPPALQRLSERRMVEAFVRALAPEDVQALTSAIEARFALPTAASRERVPGMALPSARSASATEERELSMEVETSPPWRPWAEEADTPGLAPSQRALLGIALTLVRAPSVVRSAAFAAALADWREAVAASPGSAPVQPRLPPTEEPPPSGTLSPSARPPDQAKTTPTVPEVRSSLVSSLGPPAPPSFEAPAPTSATPSWTPAPPSHVDGDAVVLPSEASQTSGEPPRPASAPSPDEKVSAPEPAIRPPVPTRREPPMYSSRRRTRTFGAPTETQFGGLFYLVNLALYLDLYGDEHNLPLPLWDFIALLGRGLLGDRGADDPVWPLLAALAGRATDEAPGAEFAPPADWRLPPAWLASFPASTARHAIARGRLLVEHEDGFLLLDLPAEAQLASELAAYGNLACVPAAAPPSAPPAQPLDRWLSRLLPYLRARLCRALDVSDDELPGSLLAHHARVHVTDTHLDIVLSLETLPVEIRLAGLDRDPGWVAAAGRFVAFHFE